MAGINLAPGEKRPEVIGEAVRQLAEGRSNAAGEVTLDAGATETVVTTANSKQAVNVALGAQVVCSAKNPDAAAALVEHWISDIGQGTFTINHQVAAADCLVGWIALGGS